MHSQVFALLSLPLLSVGWEYPTLSPPGVQSFPSPGHEKAPGTFWRDSGLDFGHTLLEKRVDHIQDPIYQPRTAADLPFGRLFYGNLSFFAHGQIQGNVRTLLVIVVS